MFYSIFLEEEKFEDKSEILQKSLRHSSNQVMSVRNFTNCIIRIRIRLNMFLFYYMRTRPTYSDKRVREGRGAECVVFPRISCHI
jgi:hypothetical protein